MSVPSYLRKENTMNVQAKAAELVAYTIRTATNEKTVPKRYRWCSGDKLVSTALGIAESIDLANSMRLDDEQEAKDRRALQRRTLAKTYALLTQISVAHEMSQFPTERWANWTSMVLEVQTLLRSWISSDDKRRKRP